MAGKNPKNHGKDWQSSDEALLRKLARGNTPTRVMGIKLGRSAQAVQAKATELGVSLRPWNQSPYGTSKKNQ